MDTAILVALITGGCAVISNIIIASINSGKTVYRIDQLEEKVNKHNNLIERMYKAEESISLNKEQIKVANHRIDDLEKERV